ncbi:MAG: hypothetical protein ABI690_08305 [Chloroflexota bacterium]
MKKRRLLIILVCLLVLSAFAYGLGYVLWIRQGRNLSPELVPTAEYLSQNPTTLPNFIGWIDPPPGATLSPGQRPCVQILSKVLGGGIVTEDWVEHVESSTQFIINKRPIALGTWVYILRAGGKGGTGGELEFCVEPQVEAGLHLIEVQVSSVSGATYTYSWVFRMSSSPS